MSKTTPCTPKESGLLGVNEKYTSNHALDEFPVRGMPTLLTDRIYLPPLDERSSERVAVTRKALEIFLNRFSDDSARQKAERERLLSRLGFDATKPYKVIEHLERGVYFFAYNDER